MKSLIIILSLVSTQAMAAVTLTQTLTNGTVAPFYQTTKTCVIEGTIARVKTTGRSIDFPITIQKAVRFTRLVPNESVMNSLMADAMLSPILPNRLAIPMGGSLLTDSGQIGDQKFFLKSAIGSQTTSVATSPSARKITAFLDFNCKN
jgi:hypothetical protein